SRQVEPPRALRPNLLLHQARRRREQHVRRHRRHHDHFNLARRNPARRQAPPRRLRAQVARRHALLHKVPFADPRPLRDPLVVGRNHPLQVRIGQQPRRNVRPHRTDLHPHALVRLQRQTQSITSPSRFFQPGPESFSPTRAPKNKSHEPHTHPVVILAGCPIFATALSSLRWGGWRSTSRSSFWRSQNLRRCLFSLVILNGVKNPRIAPLSVFVCHSAA